MKLLKIENKEAFFLGGNGEYHLISKINKDELLRIVNLSLTEDKVEFDDYREDSISNVAHQIIYQNIEKQLRELSERSREYSDECASLFKEMYEKYRLP